MEINNFKMNGCPRGLRILGGAMFTGKHLFSYALLIIFSIFLLEYVIMLGSPLEHLVYYWKQG